MNKAEVMDILRQVEWCMYSRYENHCPVCGGWKLRGHRDDCKLATLLIEYSALVAIANVAQSLRRNADMLCAAYSNADYIPAYLLAPLYDVLGDLDALGKEKK